MGKTKQRQHTLYLDPAKDDLLRELMKQTRIPRTVLLREAIDDLLVKYRVLKPPKR